MTHSQIPDALVENAMALAATLRREADEAYHEYTTLLREEWFNVWGFHFPGLDLWEDAIRDAIQGNIPVLELVWMFGDAMKLQITKDQLE